MNFKLLVLLATLNCSCLLAQNFTIDSSFGTNGKLIKNFGFPGINPGAIQIQSDGKIVTAGYASNNSQDDIVVMRYNDNGSLDNSFNGDGILTLDIDGKDETLNSMIVSGDKIFVAGSNSYNGGFVFKLNTNGTFDNSFATNGQLLTGNAIDDIETGTDSKIYLLSYSYASGPYGPEILRYNTNGTPDNSFGTNGVMDIAVSQTDQFYMNKLILATDGKFVLGGETYNSSGESSMAVLRVTAAGVLDASFNGTGIVVVDRGEYDEYSGTIELLTDGKIIFGGYAQEANLNTILYTKLIKLKADGTFDNSFSGDGISTISTAGGFFSIGDFEIQTDGKIILGGMQKGSKDYDFALARLTSGGVLDNSFDADGIASFPSLKGNDFSLSVKLQSGKPVIFGGSFTGMKYEFATARFNANGSVDGSYGTAGYTVTSVGSGKNNNICISSLLQTDGKILTATKYNTGFSDGIVISRFATNGAPDNSFGNAGNFYIDILSDASQGDSTIKTMGVQSDGKIILAYTNYDFLKGAELIVRRLNASGTADETFGVSGKALITTGTNVPMSVDGLTIQADDKVLVFIHTVDSTGGAEAYTLSRFTKEGQKDNTFNTDGSKPLDFIARSMAVQTDGKIIVTGGKENGDGYSDIAVTRYAANGAADNTFNGGNISITSHGSLLNDEGKFINILTDGKIIVTGINYVLKYSRAGVRDNSFGEAHDGIAFPDVPISRTGNKICSDGKILLTGISQTVNETTFGIATLNADGTGIYNSDGIYSYDIVTGNNDEAYTMQLQPNGYVIMAGSTTSPVDQATFKQGVSDFAMVRFKPKAFAAVVYTFKGNGNFSNAANWQTGVVPPKEIINGMEIIINPPVGSQCILDVPLTVKPGGKITVKQQTQFVVKGNLTVN